MVWHPNHLPARSWGGGKGPCAHVPPRWLATSSQGRESSECPSPFPRGAGIFFEGSLPNAHTRVPPIPMLWAQVSPPSPRSRSSRMPCAGISSLPAVGVPAGEGLLPGVCATHPVTAATRPAAGLLLSAPTYLSRQPVCLTPSSRKRFVARCDG